VTFISSPHTGGAEKQFFLSAEHINRQAPGNAFVVGARLPGLLEREAIGTTEVIRLWARPWIRGLRQAVAMPLYLFSLIVWLVRNRSRYDCILVGAFDVSLIGVGVACAVTGRPFVVRYAGLADINKLRRSLIGRVGWRLLFKAAHVVINNQVVRVHLKRDLGFPDGAITLIPNGFEMPTVLRSREEVRRELGIPENLTVFINVSSFQEGKNQEAIIKAWSELRLRESAILLLIGEGPTMDYHRALVDQRWKDEIRFLGQRNDVFELLKASDIFLYPSAYEGLPNALMEGMAAGLPCIVNETSQNCTLVENGIHGVVCRVDEPSALSSAVDRLLTSPDRGRSLAMRARNRILCDYSAATSGERHVRLLESVCCKFANAK
jgi:glycosyltransferase involved in cell wall biosynthesis